MGTVGIAHLFIATPKRNSCKKQKVKVKKNLASGSVVMRIKCLLYNYYVQYFGRLIEMLSSLQTGWEGVRNYSYRVNEHQLLMMLKGEVSSWRPLNTMLGNGEPLS